MEGEYYLHGGGSFWENVTSASSADIDLLLAEPSCDIEDLLGSESFLQELKAHNQDLISFIIRPSSILRMIELITLEPEDDTDDRRRYKLPFIASEAFSAGINRILTNLLEQKNPSPLKLLWRFLDNPTPLNPVLASYFSRTVEAMVNLGGSTILVNVFDDHKSTHSLFKHLQSPSIAELILFLSDYINPELQNIIGTGLELIFKKLAAGEITNCTSEIAENAAMVFNQILGTRTNHYHYISLFKTKKDLQDTLLQLISSDNPIVVKAGLSTLRMWLFIDSHNSIFADVEWSHDSIPFFQELLIKIASNKLLESRFYDNEGESDDKSNTSSSMTLNTLLQKILYPNLSIFKKLLKHQIANGEPYISQVNIEVLKFFLTFLTEYTTEAAEVLISENILSDIVELFFDFPWNNIMHLEASKIFICILCLGVNDHQILEALFSKTSFLKKSAEIILLHKKIIKLETREERRKHINLEGGLTAYLFYFYYLLKLASYHSSWIYQFINSLPFWKSFFITDLQNLLNIRMSEIHKVQSEEDEMSLTNSSKVLQIRSPSV